MTAIAQVFEFETDTIRTAMVDGAEWVVGKDICAAVGISKYRDALAQLDEDERVSAAVDTLGGRQQMVLVNESGVYALLLISRSPKAKPFRKWVTNEVLPAIRKTGRYDIAERDANSPQVPRSFPEALRLAADLQEQNERQAAELEAAAPKVAYVDTFIHEGDSCTLRVFAKQIGVKEKALREHLIARKVIYRQAIGRRFSESKQRWIDEYTYQPYASHAGWFSVGDQPRAPRLFNGQMRTTLYITPAGKVGVARLLERHPVAPLAIEGAKA